MSLKELAEKLCPTFIDTFGKFSSLPCKLFLSASDMKEQAVIRHAVCDTPEEAWQTALNALEAALDKKISPVILRADWVTSSETLTWKEYLEQIKSKWRNCFRRGIALDKNYRIAFTEQELNSNLILCNEQKRYGEFQPNKAGDYCRRRFDCEFPKIDDTDEVEIFDTAGVFIQAGISEALTITGKGEYAGRRDVIKKDKEIFLKSARNGGNYLARQCNEKGQFIYAVYPCNNSTVRLYSPLSHFATLSSMMKVFSTYGKFGAITLNKAISRGLEYGIKTSLIYRKFSDGREAAYFNEHGKLNLGANAAALIALSDRSTLQHTKKYIPLMKALAVGIFSFQKNNGHFVHALNAQNYTLEDEFLKPHYDGEAISALLSLYSTTKDDELLESATRAIDYFLAEENRKSYAPWLLCALNDLTVYKPEEKYFKFGIDTCLQQFFLIRDQDSQSPILPKLILAAENMLQRMKSIPSMNELCERVDWDNLYENLNRRAERMLNGYFFPEMAMYFQNPGRIVGSFFVRPDNFCVRIDDVQNYLSGLLAYIKYLNR